ncbi:FecR family protein [Dyella silvatica]|uniref:FecR family protein n=1 Tax=Dyella silvatica TaxID=2992128 RepID=UPI00224F8CCD|nr:FecR domain-containing protein [Dyella silvatica]
MLDKNSQSPKTLDASTLHAAADWWTRLRDPNGAAETVEQWLAWTEAGDQHLEAFERVNDIGNRFGALDEVSRRQLIAEFARPAPAVASPRRWLPLAAAASTVLVLLGGYLTWSLLGVHTTQQIYVNEVAKNRDITLSDGSTVALGGASTMTTRFSKNERQVELAAGEAFFEVTHNAQRPFVVTAGDLDIHDVGTAFDVRRTGRQVTIAVTEGRVQIYRRHAAAGAKAASGDMVEAVAGQRVSYDPLKLAMNISSVTPEQATGWRNDRLEFINEPLDVVVANINRYSAQPLHIADASLQPLTFTGTVNTDAIDHWLNALPQVFPLKVSKQPRQVVLSKAEPH